MVAEIKIMAWNIIVTDNDIKNAHKKETKITNRDNRNANDSNNDNDKEKEIYHDYYHFCSTRVKFSLNKSERSLKFHYFTRN